MSKAVNEKWKKTFPDTIGNQNRPATGVDDTQPFETGAFPQYMANDPVRYDLQNAAMSQSMSNDARLKEMVDARGKELDDHKVDPGAHKTGIAGNAATATKVVTNAAVGESANIAEASMANNDVARIRVSGADNAGELALETADDGTEPIVARQYTGVFKDVARTAAILDTNGNTSFPGTVVAPKFTGALNGNAATASKLASPRTISLTGKAAGSATFDGSANAAINVTSVNADTASKLSTARKINITGNATGAATFDGTSDVSINVSVSQAAHADNATNATSATKAASLVGGKVGGLWLSGMNQSNSIMQWTVAGVRDNSRYDPIMWGKDIEGNVWNLGWSADGGIGFSGYKAGRTDNGVDGGIYFDPKTGITRGNFQGALNGNSATATNADTVDGYHASDIIGKIYPVGSIYMSMSATNPATLFGVGTWTRISQGRMLLGADDSGYKAGATGGEATHTLSVNEMPAHSHGISNSGDHTHNFYGSDNNNGPLTEGDGLDTEGNGHFTRNVRFTTSSAGAHTHTISNSGGGAAHNNMSPYLVCYIWQRTA